MMQLKENNIRSKESLIEEYKRLGIAYENRAVLNVEAQLYMPYRHKAELKIEIIGDNFTRTASSSRLKYPYENGNMAAGVVMYSRLQSKEFIPFDFSMEEFESIREVKIQWFVKDTGECAILTYPVVFEKTEGEKFYTLRSCCYSMAGAIASPNEISNMLTKAKYHYEEAYFAARCDGKLLVIYAGDGILDGIEIEDRLALPDNIRGVYMFNKHVELIPSKF